MLDVRAAYPGLWIGVNLLSRRPAQALADALDACENRIDGVWSDNAESDATEFLETRRGRSWPGLYFGGTAFKYQRHVAESDLGRIAPALRETAYYTSLTTAEQTHLEKYLLMNLGFDQNGLSTVFPYMAPDNNNRFFGGELAREYVLNSNNHPNAVKTYTAWKPRTAKPRTGNEGEI